MYWVVAYPLYVKLFFTNQDKMEQKGKTNWVMLLQLKDLGYYVFAI